MPAANWLEARHARNGIEFQVLPERTLVGEARAVVDGASDSANRTAGANGAVGVNSTTGSNSAVGMNSTAEASCSGRARLQLGAGRSS